MTKELPELLEIEARMEKVVGDPPLKIFRLTLKGPDFEWPEVFGSQAQLEAFLRGQQTILSMLGYGVQLHWHIMEAWTEPSGIRWTIPRDGLATMQELSSSGEVMRI